MNNISEIIFSPARRLLLDEISAKRFSFDIVEKAMPPFSETALQRVSPLPAYEKSYDFDKEFTVIDDTRTGIFTATTANEKLIGFLVVSRSWNNCAQIEALAIDKDYRGRHIGRTLMDSAVSWASINGLRVLRLETQNTNVGACRFYETYGFVLGGYDRLLYRAINSGVSDEIALFYYLHL